MKEPNKRTSGVLGGSASTPKESKSIFSYKATWLVIGLIAGFVLGIIL